MQFMNRCRKSATDCNTLILKSWAKRNIEMLQQGNAFAADCHVEHLFLHEDSLLRTIFHKAKSLTRNYFSAARTAETSQPTKGQTSLYSIGLRQWFNFFEPLPPFINHPPDPQKRLFLPRLATKTTLSDNVGITFALRESQGANLTAASFNDHWK